MSQIIGVIVGGVITLAGAVLTTVLGHRAEDRRLLARRNAECEAAQAVLQRETLVELQEWLQKLVRVTVRAQLATEQEYREHGTFGRQMLPDDISDGSHEATVNVQRLRVRVIDDQVRDGSRQIIGLCTEVAMPAPRALPPPHRSARSQSQQRLEAASDALSKMHERIGLLLRQERPW